MRARAIDACLRRSEQARSNSWTGASHSLDQRHKTRFTVAFNGDNRLIQSISDFSCVDSVFGKLSKDAVGGGRPSYSLANIGMAELANSIRLAHERGLKFFYLLNSSCMGNQELSRATNRQIHALLDSRYSWKRASIPSPTPHAFSLEAATPTSHF